jgi:two-component system nitrate/nitrite response regulator NarL
MDTTTQRVGILEDHPFLRSGLVAALEHGGYAVVILASTPERFFMSLKAQPIDLAVLDLAFGRGVEQGLESVAQLRAMLPRVPVVLLSAHGEPEVIGRCHALDVAAFLHKAETSSAELLATLAAAAQGRKIFPAALLDAPASAHSTDQPDHGGVTARELQVLRCIAEGQDNITIAAVLGISERTVKAHVSALYRKLGLENRVQLAIRAQTMRR